MFSGIGGMELGGHKYNARSIYACDFHKASKQFFANNFKDTVFDQCDMRLVTRRRINRMLKAAGKKPIRKGDLDILTGGSPCVKLAPCNTKDARQFAPENYLMIESLIKLIQDLKPKIAWFENSDRLLSKANRQLLFEYTTRMKHFLPDYEYQIKVMYAPLYGGYQTRSRAMVVLVRKDVLNGRNISFFPVEEQIDLTKQGAHVLLPDIASFWHGQFEEVYKPTLGKIFCTLTASGREYVKDHAGNKMLLGIERKKILTGMTSYDFSDICMTHQNMLLGNMVLPQLSERMFRHFTEVILK